MNKKLIIFALATVVVVGAILLTPSKSYGDCDFLPTSGMCNCGYGAMSVGMAYFVDSWCSNHTCFIIWRQKCRSIRFLHSFYITCQERNGWCSNNDGSN